METKKVHLVNKAFHGVWRPLSGVVLRQESDFEVKYVSKLQKIFLHFSFLLLLLYFLFPPKSNFLGNCFFRSAPFFVSIDSGGVSGWPCPTCP